MAKNRFLAEVTFQLNFFQLNLCIRDVIVTACSYSLQNKTYFRLKHLRPKNYFRSGKHTRFCCKNLF